MHLQYRLKTVGPFLSCTNNYQLVTSKTLQMALYWLPLATNTKPFAVFYLLLADLQVWVLS